MTGNSTEPHISIESGDAGGKRIPFLVAEGLHVLNRQVYEAVSRQDGASLRRLVRDHMGAGAGAQALAINLGRGRTMARLTPWVISSVAEWTDTPLFVSANILDHAPVLRSFGTRIIVNAVTADTASLACSLRTAQQFGVGLVVLLVRPGLSPCGAHDRLVLAAEVLDLASRVGMPFSRLYLDPVLGCRPDPIAWNISRGFPDAGPVAESIAMIKELEGGVRTLVGLGPGTEGLSGERRDRMQLSVLSLLTAAGLDAVIMNCLNGVLMTALRGRTLPEAPAGGSHGRGKVVRAA